MVNSYRATVSYLRSNPILLAIILLSSAAILMITIFDGFVGCRGSDCGYIVGNNFKDKLQHLSVSSVSFQTWPFNSALFAGEPLQGYHYAPNLIIYLLSLVGIPVSFSFFQLLPILYVVVFPLLAIPFARRINDTPWFVGFFLVFAYLGSTLTLYQSFLYNGDFFGKEAILIPLMDSSQVMRSIHYGLSLLLMLAILLIYQKKTVSVRDRFLIAGLLFLLVGTKFYGAVIASIGIGILELILLLRNRHRKHLIMTAGCLLGYTLVGVAGVILFYNPLASIGGSPPFVFAPFAIVHHMIESKELFYNEDMLLARYYLEENGGFSSPRYWYIQLLSTGLFFGYYFGTRLVGLVSLGLKIWKRSFSDIEIALTGMIVAGSILPILLIQNGDWFNTIQFLPYATFFMSIFAAQSLVMGLKLRHQIALPAVIAGIGLLLLVTILPNVKRFAYFWVEDQYVIPQEEVPALQALADQPLGTVFVTPLNPVGSYHTALSNKIAYYYEAYENVYRNWGIDYQVRKKIITEGSYTEIQADYFYLHQGDYLGNRIHELFQGIDRYELIYEDETVVLYRTRPE